MYELFFKKQCHSHVIFIFLTNGFLKNGVEGVEGIKGVEGLEE